MAEVKPEPSELDDLVTEYKRIADADGEHRIKDLVWLVNELIYEREHPAQVDASAARIAELEDECTELLLDRHQRDRVSPCGHYRVFAMPCTHEDGTEHPSCMQCDRDAAQDKWQAADAQVQALTAALRNSERRVNWLESTAMPHARKQENANGFQRGWHAALDRACERAESIEYLRALVPEPAANAADTITALASLPRQEAP